MFRHPRSISLILLTFIYSAVFSSCIGYQEGCEPSTRSIIVEPLFKEDTTSLMIMVMYVMHSQLTRCLVVAQEEGINSPTHKELALKVKIAQPVTAGMYGSIFDYCAGRCRHNSESVVHENAYLSEFHHCFSIPSNSSGSSSIQLEARLAGINVVIGRQGESCDSVCKSNGQSCVPNKLALLNQCEVIQKYMSCKSACLSSIGAEQPAEVVDDAPPHLNPGACLYTGRQSTLFCDGSHGHTRRLCPCA